ncbi:hypothetical protein GCM10028824_06030 [Hymenobacter segetis]|uniref:Lipoprotein n=1 Tax=Hymenobacter segetis TaxID=2025509 RepID=A0ABU9LXP9_9BACT
MSAAFFSPFFKQLAGVALGSALLFGCGHALPQVPGFDATAWRADPYACKNQRRAALPALTKAKEQLYEARADDVNALLGPPDEEELRAGTEKVYYYYLEPGSQCNPGHARSGAACISLRFGPLGTVTEVLTDPLSTK